MYGENFKFRTYITEFAAVQERALRMLKIMQNTEIIIFSKKLHKIFSRNIANLSDSISHTERIIKFFPAHANFPHENKKTTKYIGHNMNIL